MEYMYLAANYSLSRCLNMSLVDLIMRNRQVIWFQYTEVQKMKQKVVAQIKTNQQLERDAASMDIRIGLLVKNRITLDVS